MGRAQRVQLAPLPLRRAPGAAIAQRNEGDEGLLPRRRVVDVVLRRFRRPRALRDEAGHLEVAVETEVADTDAVADRDGGRSLDGFVVEPDMASPAGRRRRRARLVGAHSPEPRVDADGTGAGAVGGAHAVCHQVSKIVTGVVRLWREARYFCSRRSAEAAGISRPSR